MRANYEATKIEICVTGTWTERASQYATKTVGFAADALAFDNQWVELRNVSLSTTYSDMRGGGPFVEEFRFLRVPVRKIERLVYDLCD